MECILIAAIFSRHPQSLEWARGKIASEWGSIVLASEPFCFDDTDYYAEAMGPDLHKQFLAIQGFFDPAKLADRKCQAVAWEMEHRNESELLEARPLNIDPGYVSLGKLVLASTKDRAHRIFLSQGIFAEVTMRYVGGWQFYPWTYPDYQRPETLKYFSTCRKYLLQLRSESNK